MKCGLFDHITFGSGEIPDRTSTVGSIIVASLTSLRYWSTLAYFTFALFAVHTFLPPIAHSKAYITFLGYAGLGIEAILPVPQIYSNQKAQSCKGFRISVLASWLAGDAMKMSYFFLSKEYIPWAFRMCGIFQAMCDCYLGIQYWRFGEGKSGIATAENHLAMSGLAMAEKDPRLA